MEVVNTSGFWTSINSELHNIHIQIHYFLNLFCNVLHYYLGFMLLLSTYIKFESLKNAIHPYPLMYCFSIWVTNLKWVKTVFLKQHFEGTKHFKTLGEKLETLKGMTNISYERSIQGVKLFLWDVKLLYDV